MRNIERGTPIPSDTLEDLCKDLLVPLVKTQKYTPADVVVTEYLSKVTKPWEWGPNTSVFFRWLQLRIDANG